MCILVASVPAGLTVAPLYASVNSSPCFKSTLHGIAHISEMPKRGCFSHKCSSIRSMMVCMQSLEHWKCNINLCIFSSGDIVSLLAVIYKKVSYRKQIARQHLWSTS